MKTFMSQAEPAMFTRSDIGLVRGATSGSGDNAQCKVPAEWSLCAMHHEANSFLPVLQCFSRSHLK